MPSYIVLKNPKVYPDALSGYQIVICTHSYLLRRHEEVHWFANVYCNVFSTSRPQAHYFLRREVSSQKLRMPQEWDIYNYPANAISTLILDDAEFYQRPTQHIYQAVRALPYGSCFMLNTTFSDRAWVEYSAQVTLLPGSPFLGRHHYQTVLAPPYGARPGLVVDMPKALARLMGGMMITESESLFNPKTSEPDTSDPIFGESILNEAGL